MPRRQPPGIKIQKHLDKNMDKWFKQTVLDEVIRFAQAANMPPGFIKRIKFEKEDIGKSKSKKKTSIRYRYIIVNDWGKTNDESKWVPLAKFFEFGTKQHWIEPRNKKALSWTHPGEAGEHHGHAIFFKNSENFKGRRKFSKGHYVSGLPKTLSMTSGVSHGKTRLSRKIKTELSKFTSNMTRVR